MILYYTIFLLSSARPVNTMVKQHFVVMVMVEGGSLGFEGGLHSFPVFFLTEAKAWSIILQDKLTNDPLPTLPEHSTQSLP